MSIGAFGNKIFTVTQDKIYTPDGISISESLNVEMQETDGGKPATYIKGNGEMQIPFNICLKYPYCDVQGEIEWWFLKLRSETPEYLTLGNKTFGTNKFLLHSVSVADLVIAPNGLYLKAVLSLSFSEWTKKGYKKETTKSKSKKKSTSSSGGNTAQAVKNQQIVSGV